MGWHSDKPYFGLTGGSLVMWITIACATDMSLFGYDQAVFSGVVVTDNFLELHDLVGPSRTKVLSTVTAIYNVGCFLGACVAFSLGERLGRRKTVLVGTTVMTIGAILQASSYSLPHMFVGRTIAGIGNGINTATAPVWQTETSPAKWRGLLVILELGFNIFGFSLCNWINYGLSFRGGSVAWRFPLAFQLLFMLVIFATVPWLPESPRWLIGQNRHDEALGILASLEDKPADDIYVQAQLRDIDESVQFEREHMVRWRDLLRGKATGNTKTVRRVLLGAGTQLMQQFGGINIVSYYMPTVLISYIGLSNSMARLITACNSISYLVASLAAVPLVETWGRRSLMLISTAGQGFCFLIITILLRFSQNIETAKAAEIGKASIVFFFLYFISFGVGMLGVPWLYPAEINSLPMRTKGAAIATATNWITNFVIVEITPIGIQNLGWRFWIVWAVFNASFLPVIYFFYPETANRSLEDLDVYYRTEPSLIVVGDADATSARRPRKFEARVDEEMDKVRGEHMEDLKVASGEPSP